MLRSMMKGTMIVVLTIGLSFGITHAAEPMSNQVASEAATGLEAVLNSAIQDEYNAQATYEAIMEKYGVDRPFSNIIKAEVQHELYLKQLFEKYGIEIPEYDSSKNITLPETLNEALKIAVQAEKDNISLYQSFIAQGMPDDVNVVMEALIAGSMNHQRAFERSLERTLERPYATSNVGQGTFIRSATGRSFGNGQTKGVGLGIHRNQ